MGCVDFMRLRWPSQTWVFEGSLSITSSITFVGSGTTGACGSPIERFLGYPALEPAKPAEKFLVVLLGHSMNLLIEPPKNPARRGGHASPAFSASSMSAA